MDERLEGSRFITALVAEITGFKTLLNSIDQEDISAISKFCFERLVPIATKYSGKIYKSTYDFIIVIFGLPTIYEDDPERAVKTSLAMIDAMPQINKAIAERLKVDAHLGLRIGLHSGKAIIRSQRREENNGFLIIGDIIDKAAQLSTFARVGEVIVSEHIFNATLYLFDFVTPPAVELKENPEIFRHYRVLQLKPKPFPKYGLKNYVSPMLGREKELEHLYQKVRALEQGKGGMILVLGDQGIGKSRLWFELKTLIKNNQLPITIFESSCLSYGETKPDWPFIQIFKTVFEITDTDSLEIIKEKLDKKTKELFPQDWNRILPYIAHLFSLSLPNERVQYLEPKELRLQMLLCSRDVLLSLAKYQPLLIVIDDYQWMDLASLEFLEFILNGMEMSSSGETGESRFFFPILIISLSRIEKEREFWQFKQKLQEKFGENFSTILLSLLGDETVKEIFNNLLKINDTPPKFRDDLVAKVAGNPFYLEEIIRFLIDSGSLIFDFGIWKLKEDITKIEVPELIQRTILSRIERLNWQEKNILEIASVVGRVFYEPVLAELAELHHSILPMHLANLIGQGYIECLKKEPYGEYRFKHPLIQEVIYNTLSYDRLIHLHKKTGEFVEKFFADNIMNYDEFLSYQYYAGEDWLKSYEYSIKAARKAKKFYHNKEAIEFYDRALRSIRTVNLESSEIQIDKAIETIKEKVEVMLLIGDNEKALSEISRGLSMAKKVGNRKSEADYLFLLSEVHGAVSDYDKMLETAKQASLIFQELNNLEGQAECLNNIGIVYDNQGNAEKAFEYYAKSLKLHEEIGNQKGAAIGLNNIGYFYNSQGNYEKAIAYYNDALKILEGIGDRRGVAIALDNIGSMNGILGEYDKAFEYHNKSLKIKEEIGDRWGESVSLNNIGYVYGILAEYNKALEYHNKSLKIKEEIGDQWGKTGSYNNLGAIYLIVEDYEKARDNYHKGLEISKKIKFLTGEIVSLIGLGRVYTAFGKLAEAKDYLQMAEEAAKESGNKELLRRTVVSYGELSLAQNNTEVAEDYAKLSMKLAEELKSRLGRVEALLLQARIEAKQAPGEQWVDKFKEAIRILEEMNHPFEMAKVYYYYAEALSTTSADAQSEKFKTEAAGYLQKAKEIFEKISTPQWVERCLKKF